MGKMPSFYRKNIAQGAIRRVGASNAERQEEVMQAVYWCLVIAMHTGLGMGKESLEKFGAEMQIVSRQYEAQLNAVRQKRAEAWLEKQTAGLVFVLPADGPIKKPRDRENLARKRQDAEPVWRLCAMALGRMGYGNVRRQRWLEKGKEEYRWFLEWAKDGDAYGFERLRRALEQILHESMELITEAGRNPVYAKKMW